LVFKRRFSGFFSMRVTAQPFFYFPLRLSSNCSLLLFPKRPDFLGLSLLFLMMVPAGPVPKEVCCFSVFFRNHLNWWEGCCITCVPPGFFFARTTILSLPPWLSFHSFYDKRPPMVSLPAVEIPPGLAYQTPVSVVTSFLMSTPSISVLARGEPGPWGPSVLRSCASFFFLCVVIGGPSFS